MSDTELEKLATQIAREEARLREIEAEQAAARQRLNVLSAKLGTVRQSVPYVVPCNADLLEGHPFTIRGAASSQASVQIRGSNIRLCGRRCADASEDVSETTEGIPGHGL